MAMENQHSFIRPKFILNLLNDNPYRQTRILRVFIREQEQQQISPQAHTTMTTTSNLGANITSKFWPPFGVEVVQTPLVFTFVVAFWPISVIIQLI